MKLYYLGRDSWSRPVYENGNRLFVDVEPVSYRSPAICDKSGNAFDGEPNCPIEGPFEFIPKRDTWR